MNLTGHSRGSLVVLTRDGALFCGGLIGNSGKPELWRIMDDREAAKASVERLKSLPAEMVYREHGKPFSGEKLRQVGAD